jgi:HPt (histidine-containing phosphotransfer) domain-containing protein
MATGNEPLWRRSVAQLLDTVPGQLGELHRAVTAQDHGQVKQLAHRIAGSAGYIGAQGLAVAARILEVAGDRCDDTEIQASVERLEQEFARIRVLAPEVLTKNPPQP